MSEAIESLTMPKWGMTMTEGTLIAWLVEEGEEIAIGEEVAEVETEKMLGSVEAQVTGVLRRRLAAEGEVIAVGGLLGVLAPPSVPDEEIDAFLERAAAAAAAAPPPQEQGPRTVEVAAKLGRLHALASGEQGEPVLLLHGFGGDALNWRYAIGELAARHRVIAIDLPGHGASTKQVGAADLGELAGAVGEVLDAEGIERAHLLGHSLGGLVAAHLAIQDSERVASLALIAPAGFGEEIDAEFIDAMVAATSRRELKVALRKLFADEALVTRQLAEEVLHYKRLEGVTEALAALRENLFPDGRQSVQLATELGSLELPILLIWGTEDRIIPSAQAAAAPPSARVELLQDVGHSPHVEAAAKVNSLLAEHLAAAKPR